MNECQFSTFEGLATGSSNVSNNTNLLTFVPIGVNICTSDYSKHTKYVILYKNH